MRVIIAGSRDITDYALVCRAIAASGFTITEVVSGECRGVDRLGERWAREHDIPIKRFPFTKGMGPAGGPHRNNKMAEYADALIAIPGPFCPGTRNMISCASAWQIPTYIHYKSQE